MIKIKRTKSVDMRYDEEEKSVYINISDRRDEFINIPMSKIFQVQRGIVSVIQRFYRNDKKTKKANRK
jgi:hypothetical protein